MPKEIRCYYYLHENGQVIWKPSVVTENDPDYFVSPFVKKVWKIRTLEDQTRFMLDLKKMGIKGPKGGIYW